MILFSVHLLLCCDIILLQTVTLPTTPVQQIILAFDFASECDLKQNASLTSFDQAGRAGRKNRNLLRYSPVSVL